MFSRTGGARIGYFNASWPLATLSATSDTIRLSCLGRELLFLKSNIRSLSRHGGLFSKGLRIEHTVASYPEFVVFWTFGFETLKRNLETLGYEIREAPIARNILGGEALIAGGLSFVPLFGILFGIAAIAQGLASHTKIGKVLAAVGAAGITFNILLLGRFF
jgi:hypothetical protein